MTGIEVSHGNAVIKAVLNAYLHLMEVAVEEVLQRSLVYGKSDTLALDAIPEIAIGETLEAYDQHAVLITEERGANNLLAVSSREDDPRTFRTFFISDPTDATLRFATFLEAVTKRSRTVGDVLRERSARPRWERTFGGPAVVTGPSSSVTCVRRGIPIFTAIVNFVTHQLFIGYRAGAYTCELPMGLRTLSIEDARASGKPIHFRPLRERGGRAERRFATFLGKRGYRENFLDSHLMSEEEMQRYLHAEEATGPIRIFYLSSLQSHEDCLGFVLANGEKIGEWIHWLTFIASARSEDDPSESALRLFEIYHDRPWTKDGVLMATPPPYSIFKRLDGEKYVIDVRRFTDFGNPSKIRATLLAAPRGNLWAARLVKQHGYREIVFADT